MGEPSKRARTVPSALLFGRSSSSIGDLASSSSSSSLGSGAAVPSIRRSRLASLASSLAALVFSFLNLRDHVSLSQTERATNAASKLRTSTPATYRHCARLPPSALPAWLRPSSLVFVYTTDTKEQHDNLAALCRAAAPTLTGLVVENGHEYTAHDCDEFVIAVPDFDLGICSNLQRLDLGDLFLHSPRTLARTLHGLTALTDLAAPHMSSYQPSLDALPTSLTHLRLSMDLVRFNTDYGPLSRLTRLESFSSSEEWVSAESFASLLASLGGSIRSVKVKGPNATAATRFVLPPTLSEFHCAIDAHLVTFQFPGALKRAQFVLHPLGVDEVHPETLQWLATIPESLESLGLELRAYQGVGLTPMPQLPVDMPGRDLVADDRLLLKLPCAGSLRSLDLRGAHRFCSADEKRSRVVCTGFADAFPLLEKLRLCGLTYGVERKDGPLERHYSDEYLNLSRVLDLPRLAHLTSLDLTNITGVEAYTAHNRLVRTYAEFCASVDRPADGLVLQIVEQYPLLTSLALPVLLLQTRVCVDCARLPESSRKCDPLTRRAWLHEACRLIHTVRALARLAHLRHLDIAGLGVLPVCALAELGRNPPPRLSRLTLADARRHNEASGKMANAPAMQAALDGLAMRGVEVTVAPQSRWPCDDLDDGASAAWQAPAILALNVSS